MDTKNPIDDLGEKNGVIFFHISLLSSKGFVLKNSQSSLIFWFLTHHHAAFEACNWNKHNGLLLATGWQNLNGVQYLYSLLHTSQQSLKRCFQ